MKGKITFAFDGSFFPSNADDNNIKHDAAIVIFSDYYQLRIGLTCYYKS